MEKAKEDLSDLDLMREKRLILRLLEEIRKTEAAWPPMVRTRCAMPSDRSGGHPASIGRAEQEAGRDQVPHCGSAARSACPPSQMSIPCPKCNQSANVGADVDMVDEFFELADRWARRWS